MLNTPLLQSNDIYTSVPQPNADMKVAALGSPSFFHFAIFDFEHGPSFVGTNADQWKDQISANSFPLYLFPSKWKAGSYFAFEHDGFYCFARGNVSPNIVHARGSLHSTISIISKSIFFTSKHKQFLEEASNLISHFDGKVSFSKILKIWQKYDFDSLTNNVFHPLSGFVGQNSKICNYLLKSNNNMKDNIKTLLTLWRCRLYGLKIVVSLSDSVEIATNLSYLISLFSLPYRKIENELVFHIDMVDVDKFNSGNWLVAGVTHPMMRQSETVGDVVLRENGVLHFISRGKTAHENLGFLRKGFCESGLAEQIATLLMSGNDEMLSKVFMNLTQSLADFSESGEIVDKKKLKSIGLNAMNLEFVASFFARIHSRAEVEMSCLYC